MTVPIAWAVEVLGAGMVSLMEQQTKTGLAETSQEERIRTVRPYILDVGEIVREAVRRGERSSIRFRSVAWDDRAAPPKMPGR